jgi:outer membrane protein OmpA-like peptidoglycan-associated protein
LIFTRNNYNKGRAKKSEKGINMLKLYISSKKNSKWGDIQELPFNSDEYSTGHPALSPDNHKLYFVSDMPGGFGGTDLYVVEYHNGKWGKPENLGKEINTEGNEMFPYMDELGNLYFASDGHPGLGGLDVFFVEFRHGNPFGEVENLGAPINSPKDDFGLIAKGDRSEGYFSSNRKKGYSDDNIYSFQKGCNQLELLVYDAVTKLPLLDVELRMVKNGVNKQFYATNSEGKASVCLESGADFEFKAFKEGYQQASVTYGTMSNSKSRNQKVKIYLSPATRPMVKGKVISEVDQSPIAGASVTLENENNRKNISLEHNFGMIGEGDIFRLENIYYDVDKAVIRADAKKELDKRVIPLLKKYPEIQIELRSHTDSRASGSYNMKLSEERALEVVKYLTSKGIDPERLIAKGYGESELVNDCNDFNDCPESYHQANRRTEFKILAVKDFLGYNK